MARRKKRSSKPVKTEKQSVKVESNVSGFRWGESYTSLLLGIVVVLIGVLFLVSLARNRHSKQVTSIATNIISTTQIPLHTSPVITHPDSITPTKTINTPTNKPTVTSKPTNTPTPIPVPTKTPQIAKNTRQILYTIKAGDDLWHIAEKFYNSGYNWIDIARANNLSDPGTVFSGNQLIIPIVTPGIATVQISPTQIPAPPQNISPTPNPISNEPAIKENTYTVQKGDDLWNIAVRAYGNGYKWTDIAKANNLDNPGLIFSGNVLKIPR